MTGQKMLASLFSRVMTDKLENLRKGQLQYWELLHRYPRLPGLESDPANALPPKVITSRLHRTNPAVEAG